MKVKPIISRKVVNKNVYSNKRRKNMKVRMSKFLVLVMLMTTVVGYSQRRVYVSLIGVGEVDKRHVRAIVLELKRINKVYGSYVHFTLDNILPADELLVLKLYEEGVTFCGGHDGCYYRGVIEISCDGKDLGVLNHELGHWLGYGHEYGIFNSVMNTPVESYARLGITEWKHFYYYGPEF